MNYEKFILAVLNRMAWILVVALYLFFAILYPKPMLQLSQLQFLLKASVPLGFLVLAEATVLLTGNFDLSVGQLAGFSAIISGAIISTQIGWISWIPVILTPLVPLIIGMAAGSINGLFIGYKGLNPFLITLATYMIFDGASYLAVGHTIFRGLPEFYLNFGGRAKWGFTLLLVSAFVFALILRRTSFGKSVYGVGGDSATSKMLGINVKRVKFLVYVISGLFCGFSALIYTGFLGSVPPEIADGTLLPAFAGAIIGGIELEGGRGSIINALGGVIFLGVLETGLTFIEVSPYFRTALFGVVVIGAIMFNETRRSIRTRILTPS